jgi:hypothetical protein
MNSATDPVNEQESLYLTRAGDAERNAEESWDDAMRNSWQSIADSWRALATIATRHY